jgi:hypothetical protein
MGFDPAWLALREPADHAARDPGLMAQAAALVVEGEAVIVDLGCGTGSNLRALADVLPARQSWRLVDHDPALLAAARATLSNWADTATTGPDGALALVRGRQSLTVRFLQTDLTADLAPVLEGAQLVTAAALFDLCSPAWIGGFAAALAAHRLPLYTALTYDGVEHWSPPHPADTAVLAAFLSHQRRDKGFGPSAGPAATQVLADAFAAHGYAVRRVPSAWRLGPAQSGLVASLAAGIAAAAAEAGLDPATAAAWAAARQTASAAIGHEDFLALPQA